MSKAIYEAEATVTGGRADGHGRTNDGTLDVRPGETYSFLVKCTVNHVILQPVGRFD